MLHGTQGGGLPRVSQSVAYFTIFLNIHKCNHGKNVYTLYILQLVSKEKGGLSVLSCIVDKHEKFRVVQAADVSSNFLKKKGTIVPGG